MCNTFLDHIFDHIAFDSETTLLCFRMHLFILFVFCFSFIKRIWRRGCFNNKVDEADEVTNHEMEDFLTYELHKEPLGDFTLSEYTEKGIWYNY